MMKRYISLLRGINVGGKNIIKMADLKSCFEAMGFQNVATYIQSGNVAFDSDKKEITDLTQIVENALSMSFCYESKVVITEQNILMQIVQSPPAGFGDDPENYRYDVIFVKPPHTAEEVLQDLKTKNGIDLCWAKNSVIYFARLSSMSSQSEMTKMIGTAIYKQLTIRNWNTTTKLSTL